MDRDAPDDWRPAKDRVAVLRIAIDDLAVIAEIADRFVVTYAGRIVEEGARTAISEDRQDPGTFTVAHG